MLSFRSGINLIWVLIIARVAKDLFKGNNARLINMGDTRALPWNGLAFLCSRASNIYSGISWVTTFCGEHQYLFAEKSGQQLCELYLSHSKKI